MRKHRMAHGVAVFALLVACFHLDAEAWADARPLAPRPVALVGSGQGERDKRPLADLILRPEGIAYSDEGAWLAPERFREFGLVVIANGTQRPGEGASQWTEEEIETVHDYLQEGGRLMVFRWGLGNLIPRQRDASGLPFFGAERVAYHNVAAVEGRANRDTPFTGFLERDKYSWTSYQTAAYGLAETATVLVGDGQGAMAFVHDVGDGQAIYLGTSLFAAGADADAYFEMVRRLVLAGNLRRVSDVRIQVRNSLTAAPIARPGPEGGLAGVVHLEGVLPYAVPRGRDIRFVGEPDFEHPVHLVLSRFRYRAEDGHLDALVRLRRDAFEQAGGDARLVVRLHGHGEGADGEGGRDAGAALHTTAHHAERDTYILLLEQEIAPLPHPQVYFSLFWPEGMAGQEGRLEVVLMGGDGQIASAEKTFRVASPAHLQRSGRVRLDVPNPTGAKMTAAPMTVGVPFPPGALDSPDNLRLVDEQGNEVPLQAKVTGTWSRFGSVRWVLCDFTADLDGGPRRFDLEYGPEVRRTPRPYMQVSAGEGAALSLDAGRVRLDSDGISLDAEGDGRFRRILTGEALVGAFVEHVEGRRHVGWGHRWLRSGGKHFLMPADMQFVAEQVGPEKVVLRAEGRFVHRSTGDTFCEFVNRYVVHRGSPLVRVFHTWIFTGDGNRDAINDMGWRFPLDEGLRPKGFLTSFGEEGRWEPGYYLRHHGADEYALFEYAEPSRPAAAGDDAVPARPFREKMAGERASGVAAAEGDGVRVYLGVQDFWQNFPSSLMLEDDAMTFYQWPRYGRAAQHAINDSQQGHIWRLWFAHEGETLNFRLPQALTEGAIFREACGPETFGVRYGQPESANAQGIAKTAEMWLYLTDGTEDLGDAKRTLQGLSRDAVRPVVDPAWMAASGAFYEIAEVDEEAFPVEEKTWSDNIRSAINQVERMGIYGKWIYGDLLRAPNLDERTAGLYRTFRRSHWGWPMHWSAFARSGDLDLLGFLQANVRLMSDVGFRHFAEEGWRGQGVGTLTFRLIPWAEYRKMRTYVDEVENMLHAWHMTGYARAFDVFEAWGEAHKKLTYNMGGGGTSGRGGSQMLKQYHEAYKATWDPWYLAVVQAVGEVDLWNFRQNRRGFHIWNTAPREYHRFTGCPEYEEFYVHGARQVADWHHQGWAVPTPLMDSAAYAYHLTGDRYFLRRLAGLADLANWTVYRGEEPWYYHGVSSRGDGNSDMLFTSWLQKAMPLAIHAFREAEETPRDLISLAFRQQLAAQTHIAVKKTAGEALPLRFSGAYSISGPEGYEASEGRSGGEVVLPADAPAGTYRVRLSGTVLLPISPPDTPEVLVPPEGGNVATAWHYVQHWFFVPEGAESFAIEFNNTAPTTPYYRQNVRQVVLWDGDGREAWAHRQLTADYDQEERVIRAEVQVPDGQAGRLWRLTMPGMRTMPFRLGPGLPRALAHDPARWFDPEGEM